jgi:hypothetical protein
MRKLMLGATALALLIMPATAQTSTPGAAGQAVQPTSPNSGAGVEGHPGNKNGPANHSSQTTGAGSGASNADKTPQDASKIPGMPGNKSGPAPRKPSDSGAK